MTTPSHHQTTSGPLIVQSDRTLLLEVDHPSSEACRAAIAPFAELERAPEHVHTYRLTSLGLWNAGAAGHTPQAVVEALTTFSRFPVPQSVLVDVRETMARYGRLVLRADADGLVLETTEPAILEEVVRSKLVGPLLGARISPGSVRVPGGARGSVKHALVRLGWPADDQAGYVSGTALAVALRDDFDLRDYQRHAAEAVHAAGSGVVVLPCGAGKTIVGAATIALVGSRTLILVTSTVAATQWRRELVARTTLTEEEIGVYSGTVKEVRPVTIASYQIMVSRNRAGENAHLALFEREEWGLVVYDEVHLLPAPVFRMTAEIQAKRRLGLTATLVREDGKEGEVFGLIGPKRYDAPWREIEAQGWIAPVTCMEVRVSLTADEQMTYAIAEDADRHRLGATPVAKLDVAAALVRRHHNEPTLVIGQYLDQLDQIARRLGAPLITGKTPNRERERLFAAFRAGEERLLVVSKVANFSIDLPDASVAIQVSGTFGSRQEEAQRLGRILRPKADARQARFYAVVARDTSDQSFAANRQRFLAEQGYAYTIVDASDLGVTP